MTQFRSERRHVDGVLLLDKPIGLSSNAALQRAKRIYRAQKAGHTGTLDPLASGLLPLCFGEATKFAQVLLDAPKRYTATVRFGTTTTTGDAEGEVLNTRAVSHSGAELEAALQGFVGRQLQLPPVYSALKHEGRAYYEYARSGQDVPRVPREVEIHALALVDWSPPDAVLDVSCSKGCYIRVLAEDIGEALGCGAHLAALRRTATGGFRLADAVSLERLETMSDAPLLHALLPVTALVAQFPVLEVTTADAARFRQGQALAALDRPDGTCAVFGDGRFLGVAEVTEGAVRPRRVVVERSPAEAPAA
ncbi:MAG: tRNA pseudouridine(55) synthase TruB [Burkholderiales bacterium]|nr:tRNA pseudouridine(55) synthase TruB [Burkholderiales bacterium]